MDSFYGASLFGSLTGKEREVAAVAARRQGSPTGCRYAKTKEHIWRFWLLEAADLDEALAWAQGCRRLFVRRSRGVRFHKRRTDGSN
jgi:hypothetical protein